MVAQVGETVRVRCSATNVPGALNIEWSRLAGSLPQVRNYDKQDETGKF